MQVIWYIRVSLNKSDCNKVVFLLRGHKNSRVKISKKSISFCIFLNNGLENMCAGVFA